MPQKRYKPEQIINKLREAELELSKGNNIGRISRKLGITEQTYYRWRNQYGGMKIAQARRSAGDLSFFGILKFNHRVHREIITHQKPGKFNVLPVHNVQYPFTTFPLSGLSFLFLNPCIQSW